MKKYFNLPLMVVLICTVLLLSGNTVTAAMIQYTYDNAGRLVKAEYGGGKTISYTYDPNGNLLERKVLDGIVVVYGDINNDLDADLTDVMLVFPLMIGNKTDNVNLAADVNDDDKIGIPEAIYVLQVEAELRTIEQH